MGLIKQRLLNLVNHVTVLADHLCESNLPQLRQLSLRESHSGVGVLVPKPIALLEFLELYSDNAGEGGAD